LIRAALLPLIAIAVASSGADAANYPKRDFAIAIDVGHSPAKSGAISARGSSEFSFNQKLATRTMAELCARGFSESFIVEKPDESMDLFERTARAAQKHARLFLSIHHDSVQPQFLSRWTYRGHVQLYSDRFRGYSIFYSEKNRAPGASLEFCKLLGSELLAGGLTPSLHHGAKIPGENRDLVDARRGIYRFDNLVVLRTAQMPAALLEAGVIVNRDEEIWLLKPGYQRKIARAVAEAVELFWQKTVESAQAAEAAGRKD
jgi:N-acetylmuramoyl-L-alanine amidase